ncbi:MAG: hypothetical protein JJE22_03785 [Bacteroidia bacterium]|nr:hypothetical protein [Bacteroidia bacterium]
MKAIIALIVVIFCWQPVSAQNSLVTAEGGSIPTSPNFFLMYLKDGQLVDLFNPDIYAGVEGSPYFSDEWLYARIELYDNRKFDSVLIRVNLYENKINFKDDNGRERMVAVNVKKIEIRDKSSIWNNAVFISGYGEDKNVFFQALTEEGKKTRLLKKMHVVITEKKVFNAPIQKKFELQEQFYILSDGALYHESKNCSSLMAAFGNDSKVNTFVSSNNIKCNKEKDLKKLVDYYNSY